MTPLTQIAYLGPGWFHRFKDPKTGILYETETTQADYLQLGQPNPKNPTHPLWIWYESVERPKFNTFDYRLIDGQYGVVGSHAIVKLANYTESVINATDIVGGVTTSSVLAQVTSPASKLGSPQAVAIKVS